MLVKIFLPGGKSAADVAFLFVHVKNFADALRQGWVDLLQAVGAVFMYRTLTNPKFLRSLTHKLQHSMYGNMYKIRFHL